MYEGSIVKLLGMRLVEKFMIKDYAAIHIFLHSLYFEKQDSGLNILLIIIR